MLAIVVVGLAVVAGCAGSSRDTARAEFVQQLEREGGLTHAQAVCVADKFFATRTDKELQAFFARKDLTEPEQAEFARLGTECAQAGS